MAVNLRRFDRQRHGGGGDASYSRDVFGAGGVMYVDENTTFPEELESGSGSFIGPSNVIVFNKINAISIINGDVKINKLFIGEPITERSRTALGGSLTTIQFPVGYSTQDDYYNSQPNRFGVSDVYVYIDQGTSEGQVRKIIDYDGTTRTATVDTAFPYVIDATSRFQLIDGIDVRTEIIPADKALKTGAYIPKPGHPFILVGLDVSSGGAAEVYFSR